jgi:catechol 1,2-dioxygenase
MDRKKFLATSAITAFSLSAFGRIVRSVGDTFTGECETTNDILGPFYRPNSPVRSDLTWEGLEGARVTVKGRVLGSDCTSPLEDAVVEIWHCDTKGEYDNDSEAYRLRGQWRTKKDGAYEFKTIFPGKYLNGRLYRPSHIHFRVSAPGHAELISQIYFKGDPHITKDPWASQDRAKHRILEVLPEDIFGGFAIHFDVSLREG